MKHPLPERQEKNCGGEQTEARGFTLAPRLTVYPAYVHGAERWLDPGLRFPVLDRSDAEVLDIARITRALCDSLGEARVEWYAGDGRAMVRDVSLEGGRLDAPSAPGGQLISGGVASGTVLNLPDLAELDEAARALEVSVIGSGTDNAAVMADARITAAVAAVRRTDNVIVVAEYPSAGLIPLVDFAAGFVFQRGNLLCHTAIVLRERGVPAIVSRTAAPLLRDGMSVEVSPAGVTVVHDQERVC